MITTRVHGILDHIIGIALIATPWIFGFANSGPETWVPVIVGAGSILYSLVTNYEMGLVGLILMRNHLRIDMVVAIFLAFSPWIFRFSNVAWAPHLIVGLLILGSAMMTKSIPSAAAAAARDDDAHHHHTFGRRL